MDPETADRLEAIGIDADAVRRRRVSRRELVEAGLEPATADRLRREWSLPWSFATGGDLGDRSAALGGLDDAERDWIRASAGDWVTDLDESQPTDRRRAASSEEEGDEKGDDGEEDDEKGDDGTKEGARPPRPDPVTDLAGVDGDHAERLAEAGVTSVRSLAAADPVAVAEALGLDPNRVTSWHWRARALLGEFDASL